MLSRYQKEFLKLLKKYYLEVKEDFKDLVRDYVTFKDIAALSLLESSAGYDPRLCEGGNPFQVYGTAFEDALEEASKLSISTSDMVKSYKAYQKPECAYIDGSTRVSFEFHRKHLKGALKAALSYLHAIAYKYARFVPKRSDLTPFERLILTFYIGTKCAHLIDEYPQELWDEAVSSCLGHPAKPSRYLERFRDHRRGVFFLE